MSHEGYLLSISCSRFVRFKIHEMYIIKYKRRSVEFSNHNIDSCKMFTLGLRTPPILVQIPGCLSYNILTLNLGPTH